MAGEMFGAPAGISQGEADTRAAQMNALALQTGAQKLEMGRADLAMQPLRMRALEAKTGLDEYSLRSAIDIDNIAKNVARIGQPPTSDSPLANDPELGPMMNSLSTSMRFADGLMQGGHAQAGMEIMGKTATTMSAMSRIVQTRTTTALNNNKLEAAAVGRGASILGTITNSEDYALAKDTWANDPIMQGHPFPYGNAPYDAVKDRLPKDARAALSYKDQLVADAKEKELKFKETRAGAIDSFRQFRKGIMERQIATTESREQRLKTVGGKAVSTPAKAEVDQAIILAKKDYPDMDATELHSLAFDAASQARALRANNRGLTPNEALYQGYTAARKNVLPGEKGTFGFGGKPTKYTGGGSTAASALPLPEGKDASKLISGKWYSAGGVSKQWTGTGWKGGSVSTGGSYSAGDEEDDSEE